MIAIIAVQQVQSLRRQRVVLALVGTLLAMTAMAGLIGWSSHNTIVRVYDEAVRLLAADGQPAPPNPFLLKPTLSLLSNMAIYIPLIGALLALLLGHLAMADDESNGIGRLLFSRRLSRTSYVLGKLAAAAAILGVGAAVSLIASVASLWLVNRAVPTGSELGRLMAFYSLVFVGLSQMVGAFAVGAIAGAVGVQWAIGGSALATLAFAVWTFVRSPELARV